MLARIMPGLLGYPHLMSILVSIIYFLVRRLHLMLIGLKKRTAIASLPLKGRLIPHMAVIGRSVHSLTLSPCVALLPC